MKKDLTNNVKKNPVKKQAKTKKKKVTTDQKKSIITEVREELKKVSWATKDELLKYSIATIIFIVIFAFFFFGIDALFAWITALVKGV